LGSNKLSWISKGREPMMNVLFRIEECFSRMEKSHGKELQATLKESENKEIENQNQIKNKNLQNKQYFEKTQIKSQIPKTKYKK
jgi:hypothetical protein